MKVTYLLFVVFIDSEGYESMQRVNDAKYHSMFECHVAKSHHKCGIVEKVTSRTIHQYYDVKERFFYSEGKTKRGYKIIAKKGISDLAKQQVFKA